MGYAEQLPREACGPREMMDKMYAESFWVQKLEKMLLLHAPVAQSAQRPPRASADRGGPRAAPQERGAPHVTPTIWRSLFQNTSSR